MTLAGDFMATAERLPDKVFLVGTDDRALTYADVRRRALGFAAFLAARGVGPGDRVVLTFPNGVDLVCAYLGTLCRGAVAVVVDPRTTAAQVDYIRRDTDAACQVSPHAPAGADPAHFGFPGGLDTLPGDGAPSAAPSAAPAARLPGDDALIMYTSGTTGVPKGVRLTNANLRHTVASIIAWAGVREDDRELTTLSLSHLFGLAHLHVYWTLGGTVIIEEGLRDVPRVLDRMTRHQATSFPGTPAGFRLLFDAYEAPFRSAAATLRYIVVNSAPMPTDDVRRLLALVPSARCYMYYGLTEASRSTVIHYNAHPDKLATVGRAAPGNAVVVGDAAHPVVGAPGEILVRGGHVTPGYWGLDSRECFAGDWLRTGDLGVVDDDGFLTWVGRVREQINVNGLKVAPAEVEAVLRGHPAVLDCAVAGAPHDVTGQMVVAFVVLQDGGGTPGLDTELRRFCKPRLEAYKIPRRVQFVAAIPRTDSGKVKRLALLDGLRA
jgi:long-chain acyl-CoA synthetase